MRIAPSSWRVSWRGGWPLALGIALLCHAFWQGHGLVDPAFRNPDVAGIAYNARLLDGGLLPYVHSAEIKPPGAFFLFAPLLALGGMRAVWGAAVLWGVALSLATGALAAGAWGAKAGPRAVVLHAVCAAVASDGDINYSFWMATPFTLAAACATHAARSSEPRRARWLWLGAGALAMLAVSIKPSAWPVSLLFAGLLGREARAGRTASALRGALGGALGAGAVALALSSPYALAGRLSELRAGLGDVSTFGREYVTLVEHALGGRAHAVLTAIPCLFDQLPGPLVLALLGVAELYSRRVERAPLAHSAWLFALAAAIGVSYTLRFFSHDNAQLWPALAVLAVRPAGLLARGLDAVERPPLAGLPATAAIGALAAWPGFELRWGYVHFMAERDHMVEGICRELAPRLPAGEPVLAWGWSAWSVYEHCGRQAPGRVFKVVASVTTVNTNTCNNGFGPMRLRQGPATERFLADFERRPPSLFLWSSYFKELGGDPLDDFAPLRELLRARYDVVDARGPFVALLRKDLVPQAGASGIGTYGWSGLAGSVWTSTSRTPENSDLMASITQCVTR